ncbi:dephospho-CoA kinase domain-containing protein isoform X4 [Aquila chrysaetos chrysaetos]|uniref:dephospho-CoA kinase domain-containing protein isoform X4 n=2 Tax=Aquila chrysaetos chrysaetos TaxID=223781 RepID=UPI0011771F78|nr:dephospho-CoA kinase domain-containing protein isoform X4 [Aquila chrysaetos chrysaetos]
MRAAPIGWEGDAASHQPIGARDTAARLKPGRGLLKPNTRSVNRLCQAPVRAEDGSWRRAGCSMSTMFLVGLSGGIASGKSTVVAVLRELGCAVIDADVIAREVVQPHFKAYRQIVHYFGTEILLENGEINREALGNIIFSHPEKRQLLNSITHPEIQKEMLKQIWKYFVLGYRYVILDIPLLFETNRLTKFMKYTVLVYCDPPTQLSRLMKRNRLSQAEAEARIASQLPLDEKRKLASHVIDNSGDRESTRRQVLKLHARLEDSLDFLWARLVVGTVVAGLGGLVYLLLRRFIS